MSTRANQKTNQMTDERVEALRRQVPDDPMPLPDRHLPCEGCGIAVPDTSRAKWFEESDEINAGRYKHRKSQRFGWCEGCQAVREEADRYVTDHPALAARYGPQIARTHIESVLFGLQLLDQQVPDDLGFVLPRMLMACNSLRFHRPLDQVSGQRNAYPWAHVSLSARAKLRKAYASVMNDRVTLTKPPVPLPCPSIACLMCGVGSISRPAIEVLRRGGSEVVRAEVWREVRSSQSGHACPACAKAIDAVGATGPTATSQAAVLHVQTRSEDKARRMKSLLEDGSMPPVQPWSGLRQRTANPAPWSHLVKVIDRL